jgi:hypothetical protein
VLKRSTSTAERSKNACDWGSDFAVGFVAEALSFRGLAAGLADCVGAFVLFLISWKPSSSAVASFMPGNVSALSFSGKYCLKQLRGLQITNIFPWRIKK